MQHLLDQCREDFGSPERSFSLWERLTYLHTGRPDWCGKADGLGVFFKTRNDLLKHGQVVWGHIVQANMVLFKRGIFDAPAAIVFPAVSNALVDPEELADVASRLFDLRDTGPLDGQLATVAEHLADEFDRAFGMPVPDSLSPEFKSMLSSSVIARHHLPRRRLCCSLLPIIVSPGNPKIVMPLPSRYWPEDLVDWWTDQQ